MVMRNAFDYHKSEKPDWKVYTLLALGLTLTYNLESITDKVMDIFSKYFREEMVKDQYEQNAYRKINSGSLERNLVKV
jgi:hypothetical protein